MSDLTVKRGALVAMSATQYAAHAADDVEVERDAVLIVFPDASTPEQIAAMLAAARKA